MLVYIDGAPKMRPVPETDMLAVENSPFPIVLALTITAAGTVLLFVWPDVPLALATRLGEVGP